MLSLAAPLLGRLGSRGVRSLRSLWARGPARWRAGARPGVVGVPASAPLPAGLDVRAFLAAAREHFLQLQAAWDAADRDRLAVLATGPLLDELREQLDARGAAVNRTDVLQLRARLLAFEELHGALVASVEFSGLVREQDDRDAQAFRELWLLARVGPGAGAAIDTAGDVRGERPSAGRADAGWRLAQVQALG